MAREWLDIKTQSNLGNKQHYFWIQQINAMPKSWNEELRRSNHISNALSVYDHHWFLKKIKYILQISVTAKNYTVCKYL